MEISDLQLIEQLQAGQESAFDELMARYKRPVVNFCYRMIGDEAEDVAQEVFVRVYQNIGQYRPRAKPSRTRRGPPQFTTWLFALARNACIDRLRYRKRHPTEPLEGAPEPAVAPQLDDLSEQIARAVGDLPEDQRTAIVLAEYHGLSYTEIAGLMKCSEKSVESRLYRARIALRAKLAHLLD